MPASMAFYEQLGFEVGNTHADEGSGETDWAALERLVALATEHDFLLFEDDPYRLIHFGDEPGQTMLDMDTADRAEPEAAELKQGRLREKIAALKEQLAREPVRLPPLVVLARVRRLGGGVGDLDEELLVHGPEQALDLSPALRASGGGVGQLDAELRAGT